MNVVVQSAGCANRLVPLLDDDDEDSGPLGVGYACFSSLSCPITLYSGTVSVLNTIVL